MLPVKTEITKMEFAILAAIQKICEESRLEDLLWSSGGINITRDFVSIRDDLSSAVVEVVGFAIFTMTMMKVQDGTWRAAGELKIELKTDKPVLGFTAKIARFKIVWYEKS